MPKVLFEIPYIIAKQVGFPLASNVIGVRQYIGKGALRMLRLKIAALQHIGKHRIHQCIGRTCRPLARRQAQMPFAQPRHNLGKPQKPAALQQGKCLAIKAIAQRMRRDRPIADLPQPNAGTVQMLLHVRQQCNNLISVAQHREANTTDFDHLRMA